MSAVLKNDFISAEEYLAGELLAEVKHEYIDGYVYAMAGASINHGLLSSKVLRKLADHLENTPCHVIGSDLKVNVGQSKFFYPDVVVICDPKNSDDYYTDKPVLIVEVLSKSTHRKDKTIKKQAYQSLPSLQEYVLIEQDVVEVIVYRRDEHWFPQSYFLGDEVYFKSVDFRLPVEEIYRRVDNEEMRMFWQTEALKADG